MHLLKHNSRPKSIAQNGLFGRVLTKTAEIADYAEKEGVLRFLMKTEIS